MHEDSERLTILNCGFDKATDCFHTHLDFYPLRGAPALSEVDNRLALQYDGSPSEIDTVSFIRDPLI